MNYPSLSLSQASIENIFATESSKEQFQSDDTATRTYKPNIKRVLSNTKYRDYLCIDSNEDKAFQKHPTLKEKFANKSFTEQFANNEVRKCEECEFKTSIQEQMRQHMLIKHSGIKHKCPQCEYTHYYPNRVKSHENQIHKKILRITGKKIMLCNDITCSHFGSNECKEIELHGRHKCAECDFVTIRLQDLKRHIERKHEGVIYRCEKCQYFSKSKYDLHIHRQSKHSNIQKKNSKITENKKNVKITVNKNMVCNNPVCPHFGSNECKELKLHGRHKCAECDFVAKRLNNLSKHVRSVHEGVVYPCEKCQYYSTRKYNLNIHIHSKHDGFMFSCEHCEFSAQMKGELKDHINTAHKGVLQWNAYVLKWNPMKL